MNIRLDLALVQLGYFKTRNKSQEAIRSGVVKCDGNVQTKCNFTINKETKIEVGEVLKYVSRAGLKFEKAIEIFNINLVNKLMLDIGSSTGGFTDCAIQKGIKRVIAVDVGTDVINSELKKSPKIELHEQTDIREMDCDLLSKVQIATVDISFISVTKILSVFEKLKNLKEIVLLIKPQFECGKQIADKYKGLILNKTIHKDIINNIIKDFSNINFYCQGLAPSPIKGGSGNIEYISYFKKDASLKLINIQKVIDEAFNN